jgi:hypothetical protein
MLKKLLDIRTLTILVLVSILLFKQCGNGTKTGDIETISVGGKKYELLKHTIDTQYVDRITEVPKYVPKYITKVETQIIEIPVDADTIAIIKDYFSTYLVNDTLKLNDDLGWVYIKDEITQNKIKSRELTASVRERTITDTKIVKELPKHEFYYGVNMTLDRQNIFNGVGGGFTWKDKQNHLYQLGVGVTQNNSNLVPVMNVGLQWKIGKKKK